MLGAAVAAFAEKGFHGTTTRDIAAAAGMSPAALYLYFRSKEELLYVISRAGHQDTLALVLRGRATGRRPDPQRLRTGDRLASPACRDRRHPPSSTSRTPRSTPSIAEIQELRRRIDRRDRSLVGMESRRASCRPRHPHVAATAVLSLAMDLAPLVRDGGAPGLPEMGGASMPILPFVVARLSLTPRPGQVSPGPANGEDLIPERAPRPGRGCRHSVTATPGLGGERRRPIHTGTNGYRCMPPCSQRPRPRSGAGTPLSAPTRASADSVSGADGTMLAAKPAWWSCA